MRTVLTQEQTKQVTDEAKAWIARHNWQSELDSFDQLVEIEEFECYLLRVAFDNFIVTYPMRRTANGLVSLLNYTYYPPDFTHPSQTAEVS